MNTNKNTYGNLDFDWIYLIKQSVNDTELTEIKVVKKLSNAILISYCKKNSCEKWFKSSEYIYDLVDKFKPTLPIFTSTHTSDVVLSEKTTEPSSENKNASDNITQLYNPIYILEEYTLGVYKIVDISRGIVFSSYTTQFIEDLKNHISIKFNQYMNLQITSDNKLIITNVIDFPYTLNEEESKIFEEIFDDLLNEYPGCITLESLKYNTVQPKIIDDNKIDFIQIKKYIYSFIQNNQPIYIDDIQLNSIEIFVNRMIAIDEKRIKICRHDDYILFLNIYSDKYFELNEKLMKEILSFFIDILGQKNDILNKTNKK